MEAQDIFILINMIGKEKLFVKSVIKRDFYIFSKGSIGKYYLKN